MKNSEDTGAPRNFRTARRLFQPFSRLVLSSVGLLFVNAIFSGISFLFILPVLEAISSGADIATLTKDSTGFLAVSKFALYLLGLLGIENILAGLSGLLIILFFLKSIISFGSNIVTIYVGQTIRRYWMTRIARYYFHAPFAEILGVEHGEAIDNLRRQTKRGAGFVQAYLEFWMFALLSLSILISMVVVNWQFFIAISIFLAGIYVLCGEPLSRRSRELGQKNVSLSQRNQQTLTEAISGLKEFRVLNRQFFQMNRIDQSISRLNHNQLMYRIFQNIPGSFGEFISILIVCSVLFFISFFPWDEERRLLAELIFVAIGFMRVFSIAVNALARRMALLNKRKAALVLLEIENRIHPNLPDKFVDQRRSYSPISDAIELRNINFRHDDDKRFALCKIFLTLERGETYFLLGQSGSGKSTLIDIIARQLQADTGTIVSPVHPARIGYVSQNPVFVADTLRDNLTFGEKVSDNWLMRLLRLVALDQTVADLPNGFDTNIEGLSTQFSDGQKKRMAIVRALVIKPELLIIDEATANFEDELEQQILEGIRRLLPEAILLVSTHRVSSIRDDAKVIVLKSGSLLFVGTKEASSRIAVQSLGARPSVA